MDTIQSYADAHGGVFTRTVLLEAGLTDDTIQRRVRRGHWVRLRRGVYVDADRWRVAGDSTRHVMRAHAVALRCESDVTFSHLTGAVLRGWPTWNLALDTVHVTRGPGHAGRQQAGIHHFEATLPDDQVETIDGLRVCSKERMMVDIAREYGFEEAVVLCDAALRDGASREQALGMLRDMYTWPRIPGVARILKFADGRAESVGESRLRVALHLQGLDGFEPQVELRAPDGRFLGRGDLVDTVHRVLVEFDGRSKYGIDGNDPVRQLWEEKSREDDIRRILGYEVIRVYWSHLSRPWLIAERIRAARSTSHDRNRQRIQIQSGQGFPQ